MKYSWPDNMNFVNNNPQAQKLIDRGEFGYSKESTYNLSRKIRGLINVEHAIPCSNGTSALVAAIMAAEKFLNKKKLNIVVPSFTFVATINAPLLLKHNVSILGVNRKTWLMEGAQSLPRDIDVIICTDLGGFPCDYEFLKENCSLLIADSAESLGSTYKGKPVGTQADIHCFSLHRAKVAGCGEGGFITTNNPNLARYLKGIVNHGYSPYKQSYEYSHDMVAGNFRLSGLHCELAAKSLMTVDRTVRENKHRAEVYKDELSNIMTFQQGELNVESNYFFVGARFINKSIDIKDFCRYMHSHEMEVKMWTSLPKQEPYLDIPTYNIHQSKDLDDEVVLFPNSNIMSIAMVREICDRVRLYHDAEI